MIEFDLQVSYYLHKFFIDAFEAPLNEPFISYLKVSVPSIMLICYLYQTMCTEYFIIPKLIPV